MECTLYIVYNIYIYKLLAYQELEFLVHSLLQSSVIQLQLQTVIVSSDTGNIVQIQQQREIVRQLDRDSCSQLQQKQYTHTHSRQIYIVDSRAREIETQIQYEFYNQASLYLQFRFFLVVLVVSVFSCGPLELKRNQNQKYIC